jgi:hypothetical protein
MPFKRDLHIYVGQTVSYYYFLSHVACMHDFCFVHRQFSIQILNGQKILLKKLRIHNFDLSPVNIDCMNKVN